MKDIPFLRAPTGMTLADHGTAGDDCCGQKCRQQKKGRKSEGNYGIEDMCIHKREEDADE